MKIFHGAFQSHDWDRFDAYAQRVKEFTLRRADEHLAPWTYVQLAILRPHPLPALEILRCLSVTPSLSYLPLFISPTIKTVKLGSCASDNIHVVDSFLSFLANNPRFQSPELKHLVIRGRATTACNVDFSLFSHLQSLDVAGEVDLASLKEIGTLPRLENLVVTISQSVTDLEGDIGFAKLKSLHVTASFSMIKSMIGLADTCDMERVTLVAFCAPASQIRNIPMKTKPMKLKKGKRGKTKVRKSFTSEASSQKTETWASCIAELSSRWSASLMSLTLLPDELTDSKKSIPPGLFSHLPPFSKLERLHLNNCHFKPSNEEIRDVALACPELVELRLSVVDCISRNEVQGEPANPFSPCGNASNPLQITLSPRTPTIEVQGEPANAFNPYGNASNPPQITSSPRTTTIEALWTLAESCRHLKTLEIGLDIDYIPPFYPTAIFSHGLEKLSVGSLELRRPTRQLLNVGRHLFRLFPSLQHLEGHIGYSADDWQQINEIVQTFQDVCMDETKRQNF